MTYSVFITETRKGNKMELPLPPFNTEFNTNVVSEMVKRLPKLIHRKIEKVTIVIEHKRKKKRREAQE